MIDINDASLIVATLTLVFTAIIPLAIYWLGRKGERITTALLDAQRRLLTAQRLDTLAVQAEQMSDPNDLSEILKEAHELATGRNLGRIIECYWRNPQVPLCGSVRRLDGRAALITAQHLHAKLEGRPRWQAMRELGDFVSRASRFADSSFIASRVSEWILSRFTEDSGPSHYQIRDLLKVAPVGVFYELLDPLDNIGSSLPIPARVNILAAVSVTYLDTISFYPKSERLVTDTTEKSDDNYDLSRSLAEKLGSLLHRGRLRGLADWNSDGCSIPADSCAALLVATTGATSFCSAHLAMRALQNISELRIDSSSLGTFIDEFEFGKMKFAQYRPELLDRYWPSTWRGDAELDGP